MRAAYGALLRAHRLRRQLTQQALAELAGISSRTVGEMERDRGRGPRPGTVERLATALGLAGEEREQFTAAGRALFWANRAGRQPRTDDGAGSPAAAGPQDADARRVPRDEDHARHGPRVPPHEPPVVPRRLSALRFAVLGPLRVERDGRPIRLGPRLVELLTLLLLESGRAVPASRLAELLGSSPRPERSPATLRSHVSHLRRALEPDGADRVIVSVGGGPGIGYRLDVDDDAIDARRFERACAEARRLLDASGERDARRAADILTEGLALWRGPAFADVADRAYALPQRARLEMLRRAAWLAHAEALSDLGRHVEAAAGLASAVAAEPYDEGLRAGLVRALYAQGRVVEGAEVCRDGLSLLGRRGIDSPELRELQRLVLRREMPTGSARMAARSPLPPLPPPPNPLWFVGRADAIREAVRRLCGPDQSRRGVLVVTGLPGVGKTSFALRVAHAVADRFPDGQIHIDLRGFDPSGTVMTPEEALRTILEALGVPPERIPDSVPAQRAQYRERLTGRRVLVVLDNARDDGHVRALLPGAPGCAVIVTSRNQLPSLIVTQGAHPLTLDLLSPAEAEELVVHRLGGDRVRAEPDAVGEIIARCARLPLALSIVAARAAVHPTFLLRTFADELRDIEADLGALSAGDDPADIRAVFSWSYRAVSADAARLFRLLGLHLGTDVDADVAAGLAGAPIARIRPLLAELARFHLVSEHRPGRYALHDLLRAYAGELARTDPDQERRAARRRLLDHYLHTAHSAERLLWPHRDPIELAPPAAGVTPTRITDEHEALAWFTTEHATLLAAVPWASSIGLETHTWQLAWTLTTFLNRQGRWRDLVTTQVAAHDAAERLDDPRAKAQSGRDLAIALTQVGEHDAAYAHLTRALALYRELGDPVGQAHTHINLGWVCECLDRRDQALEHDLRALELFRAAGHKSGQGRALNAVGWDYVRLGRYEIAIAHCQEALTLHQALGNSPGEARAWDSLGYAHHHLGDHDEAVTCYRRSLEHYRQGGDRYGEAETLIHLGDAHHAAGAPDAASQAWRDALVILDDLGHSDAEEVRAKLRGLSQPAEDAPGAPPH
ncbi:tetratricopeptide repeat protein [Sphaerisporangium album]|uniref:tetratricopeptide repeat protein n=1 Tax=Sphaerisporangium album TaxID=509200 RepID=UPI0015F02DC9|nr:tetratricopeptide repeat protein [Sphaerisporangium album]